VILTLDDGRVGMSATHTSARLNVTSLALAAPAEDWAAHFKDANGTGEAWIAGDDGQGRDKGIIAQGAKVGGQFYDTDGTGEARLAYSVLENGFDSQYGVWAKGEVGGYFESTEPGHSKAYLGGPTFGVVGESNYGGGLFEDTDSTGWAEVGAFTYKVRGNGGVSFVQNHPHESDRVIVYTAPEGDEVATYTRGTARLVNGESRVPLGETFQWVTNPDIGLTAHLTPRGDCEGLFVESLTTGELVVRELRGGKSDVAFDYIIHGLRIGFEEVSTVQEKTREARTPSMARHRAQYTKHPELRRHNALEKFRAMRRAIGAEEPLDLAGAAALRDAINPPDADSSADPGTPGGGGSSMRGAD